ncbi:MAG: Phosphate transport system substrate-binding protein [Verrucomicrobia bacterium]|nr:Phosphate transport system substrate-binding protein [Verrucomicrobiota bacterium]
MAAHAASSDYAPESVTVPRAAGFLDGDGKVAVVGYNDMAEMLEALTARFATLHPGINFALNLKGTKTAAPALMKGDSAFAPMGAEFSPGELAEYRAATHGVPRLFRVAHCSLNPRALSGPLAIVVHASNAMKSITLPEVSDIFAGRSKLGLHLYGLMPETALGLVMRNRTLGGGQFAAGFKGFPQSRDVVAAVAADPLGIGFTAAMRATPGVKVLALASDATTPPIELTEENLSAGRYALDRFLLIYTRQPLEPLTSEFLRFVLSHEGQEIIAHGTLGYLPLNSTEAEVERTKLY